LFVDIFTKWVEVFAVRDGTAPNFCKVLKTEIFARWGTPKANLSDIGINFRGNLFKKVFKTWNVKQKFTLTYYIHKQISQKE